MKKILLTASLMAMLASGAAMAEGARAQMAPGPMGQGPGMMAADLLQTPFAEVDADSSGNVSLEEFLGLAEAPFANADTNGDGALSPEEISTAAMARVADQIRQAADQMVKRFDANGDGMLQSDEMPDRADPARMLEMLFGQVDTNSDGAISAEEYGAAAAFLQQMGPQGGPDGHHGMRDGQNDHERMGGFGGWFGGRNH